jgi:hypothetical protein
MEIIPIVININMATIIVTGLFNENSDKFIFFASGGQGGLFLKKPPPLDPPAKTFY